jgi:hypothetical protein
MIAYAPMDISQIKDPAINAIHYALYVKGQKLHAVNAHIYQEKDMTM